MPIFRVWLLLPLLPLLLLLRRWRQRRAAADDAARIAIREALPRDDGALGGGIPRLPAASLALLGAPRFEGSLHVCLSKLESLSRPAASLWLTSAWR